MFKLVSTLMLTLAITSCNNKKAKNPFYISSVTPANNIANVDAYATVKVNFSEDYLKDSLTFTDETTEEETSQFNVVNTETNEVVAGTITFSDKSFEFVPDEPLIWSTTYNIFLGQNLKSSVSDNTLGADLNYKFITSERPVPTLTGISHTGTDANSVRPIRMVVNFEPTDPLEYFSDAIQVKNLTTDTVIPGYYEVDKTEREIVFYPFSTYLPYNSRFQVQLVSSLSGVSGRDAVVLTPERFEIQQFSTPGPKLMFYSPVVNDVHPSPDSFSNNRRVEINFVLNYNSDTVNNSTVYLQELGTSQFIQVTINKYLNGSSYTLVTNQPLKYDTTYLMTVTNQVVSSVNSSIRIPQTFSWTFSTQPKLVTSLSPVRYASNFLPGNSLVLTTNFDLDKSNSFFEVLGLNSSDSLVYRQAEFENLEYNNSGLYSRTLVIASSKTSDFQYDQFLSVSYSLYEKDGGFFDSSDYTVEIQEKSVGTVNRSPFSGQTNVDADDLISFGFNGVNIGSEYALDFEFFPSELVTVRDCSGYAIPGSLDVNSTGSKVTFTPDFLLDPDCRYTVTVKEGVRLTDSNKTTSSSSWSFTTDSFEITSVSTDSGFDGVSIFSDIDLHFSEWIDYVDTSGVYMLDNFGAIVFTTVYRSGSTLTISPISALDYDTFYTVVVEYDAVRSDEEFNLLYDFEYDFYTETESSFSAPGTPRSKASTASAVNITTVKDLKSGIASSKQAVRTNERRNDKRKSSKY